MVLNGNNQLNYTPKGNLCQVLEYKKGLRNEICPLGQVKSLRGEIFALKM